MNQTLILALLAVMMGATGPASAQNDTAPRIKSEYLPIPGRTLEQRHMDCIDNPDCEIEERLMLLEEMNDEMAAMIERMNATCMELDYDDCIDPRSVTNERWHNMHNHSGEMMFSMEMGVSADMGPFMTEYEPSEEDMERAGETMSRQEPAAGPAQEESRSMMREQEREQLHTPSAKKEEKSWWQRLFGDDDAPNGKETSGEYD